MNIKHFFTTDYLFAVNTVFISPKEKLFFVSGIVLVLLAIVLKIASKLSQNPADVKYRTKYYHLFLTIGLSELVWYFCRWQNVRFFNTKFIAWLIILAGIIWFIKLSISTYKNYSSEKAVWEKEQVKAKYLPK